MWFSEMHMSIGAIGAHMATESLHAVDRGVNGEQKQRRTMSFGTSLREERLSPVLVLELELAPADFEFDLNFKVAIVRTVKCLANPKQRKRQPEKAMPTR